MEYNRFMNTNTTPSPEKKEEQTRRPTACCRHWKQWAAGAVICVLFVFAAVVFGYIGTNPLLPARSGFVHIRSAMSATDTADALYQQGYISSTLWFRLAATASGKAGQLKEGEYLISTSMSTKDILDKLASGKSEAARLVIPEGYTVWQIAKAVAQLGTIPEEEFLAAARSDAHLYPYMKGNRAVTFPAEGFLFPDTYFIAADATADDIIQMMLKNFDDHVTADMRSQIAARNLSIYQFVTLASLVEKEAKYEQDRPLIASVFLNRLQQHMKLQSDASISYAMGSHKAAYSIAETQYDSPYNTYMYEGLPPGAIGNPGMECMNAVLEAPETSYLYFVADGDGHNYFAVTYEDHMKNVEEHMP